MKKKYTFFVIGTIAIIIIAILVQYFRKNGTISSNYNTSHLSSESTEETNLPNNSEENNPKNDKPKEEEISSFSTPIKSKASGRLNNIRLTCSRLAGKVITKGETFSFCGTLGPSTAEKGYEKADVISHGDIIQAYGGGNCQVSSTLYNAVLAVNGLDVTERHPHGKDVNYVPEGKDAAVSYGSMDFKFVNNLDYPIYIEGYTQDKKITFNIYGKETRDAGRTVTYESEVLEVIRPTSDNIYPDGGHGIGYIVTESAHIGYKARLWKVVRENGVEVSREKVNSSNYKVSPRSATVGVATGDANAYNEIMAAIGTGNIDHVKGVIAGLTAAQSAPVDDDDDDDDD